MIAVITGDIINSRKVNPEEWLPKLKKYFSKLGKNPINWEIYRGDSFQIEIAFDKALEIAIAIKALIKMNNRIDVRMSIGIGSKEFSGKRITECSGSAFVNSGEIFEKIKNNTLNIKTENEELNEYFSTIIRLMNFISDNWKPATSETIFFAITNQHLLQKEIAVKLKKDTTTINKALKRGAYAEILEAIELFNKKANLCLNL